VLTLVPPFEDAKEHRMRGSIRKRYKDS
jgi:hypothetical protein